MMQRRPMVVEIGTVYKRTTTLMEVVNVEILTERTILMEVR